MCDKNHGEFLGIDVAEEGQAVSILFVDHKPAIKHDLLAINGEDEAGTTDLAACP